MVVTKSSDIIKRACGVPYVIECFICLQTFLGPLDGSKVRVVIASENGPLSDKLRYAMDNGIACLKVGWVYESIKVGYALPFRNFLIESSKASSTPEKLHST